jgi:carboxypeptidase T
MKKLFFLILVLSFTLFSQTTKQVKIYLDADGISSLHRSGLFIDDFSINKDNSITAFLTENEFLTLKQSSIRYEILIEDFQAYYESLPKLNDAEKQAVQEQSIQEYGVSGFTFGSMGGFYTYNEIIRDLDSMYARYPHIITQKQVIGLTHEGREIYGLKISDNPNVFENEPASAFDALIHAREPQSMATLMYFMWYLLENYGTDPLVTYIVNNREIYFVPITNPDGYEWNRITYPNGNGSWRKNRRNNGTSYGVDLNRNFSYMWGYDNSGSSPTPSSDTYRGPYAFSEPEAQALRDFVIGKNINTHFNMHSYQNAILYPWGYINSLTPDATDYIEFASDMCAMNLYVHGNSNQILGYNSNGSVRDWMYGEQTAKNKIFGYTIEIGSSSDGFWPVQSRIFPIAQINVNPNMYQCLVAGEYISFVNQVLSPNYLSPGIATEIFPVLRNKGLADGTGVTVQISSLSSHAQVSNGTITAGPIAARSTVTLENSASILVENTAVPGQQLPFLVTVSSGGYVVSTDTIKIVAGIQSFAFIDTTASIDSLWLVTAVPSTPKWENTTAAFYSSPHSYTESRIGNYVNNATVIMTLKNNIDLTGLAGPVLTFQTKYAIETQWDCGVVQISTNNGSTWTTLSGKYTKPASGKGKQIPTGMPIYDGTAVQWLKEEMDLSAYAGQQVKVRFEFRTDGSTVYDGWYLDDIGILHYVEVPVELVSFSVSSDEQGRNLSWTTASETNNLGFEVEKSLNKNEWSLLGFVSGKGTTTETTNYSFIDNSSSEWKVYYRLKQIDYDGSYTYSGIVESEGLLLEYSLMQNYPNPFNPLTIIEFAIPKEEKVSLKVFDIQGAEAAVLLNETKAAGKYKISFDATSLTSGVYFYQLITEGKIISRKMAVLK